MILIDIAVLMWTMRYLILFCAAVLGVLIFLEGKSPIQSNDSAEAYYTHGKCK